MTDPAGEDKDPAANSEKEGENKDTSGSSTVDNKTLQKSEEVSEITFLVTQKNVRSLNSSDRTEVCDCRWDALLISESWKSEKAEVLRRTKTWEQENSQTNTELEYC